jgi:cation diffusion facilitator family transporter
LEENRLNVGMKAGIFGIVTNVLLSAAKLTVGCLTGSVAVTADGANNFFDASSSLASLIGFRMAAKKADKEHPYGHGRMEYLAGLVIALLIIVTGVQFFIVSVQKITNPVRPSFSAVYAVVLGASIIIKLFMGFYYRYLAKKAGSMTISAQASDSFSDVALTAVILIALLLSPYTDFPVDGVAGCLASAVITVGGILMLREILSPMLGSPPQSSLVREITALIMKQEHILGVHDLLVHEYGPGCLLASIHAELPSNLSFSQAHNILNAAESSVKQSLNVDLVIHGDPVDVDDPKLQTVRYQLKSVLTEIDEALAYHDLRLIPDGSHTDVVFDLVIPYSMDVDIEAVRTAVAERLRSIDPGYDPHIECDRI